MKNDHPHFDWSNWLQLCRRSSALLVLANLALSGILLTGISVGEFEPFIETGIEISLLAAGVAAFSYAYFSLRNIRPRFSLFKDGPASLSLLFAFTQFVYVVSTPLWTDLCRGLTKIACQS